MTDRVKIYIKLKVDEDGYPPFSVESLWATPQRQGLYKIDNIPFYAKRLSCDDVVSASKVDGVLEFVKVVEFSPNSTIRVIFLEDKKKDEFTREVESAGCSYEWFRDRALIAISAPDEIAYNRLTAIIKVLYDLLVIDYEESALRF